MGNITILCRAKTCKYNVEFKGFREAYRFQCGNDEIEIDMNMDNIPQCYSYSEKIEREDE